MSSRIHGERPQQGETLAQENHAEQAHVQQGQVSHTAMQRSKLHAKIQHNKAQSAAFFRNKRYATSLNKALSPANQKLARQLGQRPRPGAERKVRERDHERERREDGARDQQHERREPERDQEHERGQQHGQSDGRNQGGERGGNGQQQGQREQHQHGGARDGRKPRETALKVMSLRTRKARAVAAPSGLQKTAETERESPHLPDTVAAAYTDTVVGLASKLELGHLIAPLLVLDMTGPMVPKRQTGRLQALRNGALAQRALGAENPAAGAQLLGHTLDLTLARQRFRIAFGEDQQSLAAARQRLIDASGARGAQERPAPAGAAQPAPGTAHAGATSASETTQPVRVSSTGPVGAA